jgi:hypothetical protein
MVFLPVYVDIGNAATDTATLSFTFSTSTSTTRTWWKSHKNFFSSALTKMAK